VTGVELWKPYGGCGVADAVMAAYSPGAEDALEMESIGLIGDL